MAKSEVPDDIRRKYIEKAKRLKKQGKPVPDLEYNGKSYFADNKGANWGGWRLRSRSSKKAQGDKRRAQEKGKLITLEERYDWYRRNLYDNPMQRALQDHADDARIREELNAQYRREGKAYEHLSPLAGGSMGGFEHHRNIDGADPTLNLKKSDKVASLETYRKNRVPTSRASAIRMDAQKVPIPNHDRFASVYEDIEKNQRPKSALKDQLRLKAKSKLAQNRVAAQAAEAAKHGGRYSGFMKGLKAVAKAVV